MSTATPRPPVPAIEYPDSDGKPMAENTLQFEWIVTIKEGLDAVFRDDPDVFVAGDLLWYPVEGHPEISAAPDALVAFGRPKGYRGSYKQWEEGDIAPQVVFEVLSPSNRADEMAHKFDYYERHGVEEYYIYDPDRNDLAGWRRGDGGRLEAIPDLSGYVSPRLGVRFEPGPDGLKLYGPDGQPFATYQELYLARAAAQRQAEDERRRAEDADRRAEDAERRAEDERRRAEDARRRADRLAAQLRALGIEPDGPADPGAS